jgi:ribosomal protein S17
MRAQSVCRAGAALSILIALVLAVSPALAEPTCTASFQCDDGNPCTTDTCDADAGCVYTYNTNVCTDGNACTLQDACSGGACVGTPVTCDDQNECTTDSCDPATGCVFSNNTAACDDGNACTDGDTCTFGTCRPGSALSCSDNNPCTDDSCDPVAGCVHANNTAPCVDLNACTTGDTCSDGACSGTPIVCDDGNLCTTDTCDTPTGCVYTNNANPCDDGSACTVGDQCAIGSCHAGPALNCNDNNVCTTDSCDPATGCVNATNAAACSDGDACTVSDVCSGGACQPGAPRLCGDNNVCTTDTCAPATGCVFTNNQSACNDQDACTSDDTCSGGACAGVPRVCDDANLCTTDSCNPATGCVFSNNAAACDDGNACTDGDACAFGTCRPGSAVGCNDNNPCTNDSCDPIAGCVHVNNTAPCVDLNACTTGDTCSDGACVGTPVSCDDNNVCTTDGCDTAAGCLHTSNSNACDDGNDCTTGDFCAIGTCRAGTPAAQIVVRVSDELVGAAGGTLSVPLQAMPAGGNSIDVTLAYDPAVLQAIGATVTAITLGAAMTVDLAIAGAVHITLDSPTPFSGSGPVAMVQFQVVGAVGSASALNLDATSVNGFAVTSCGDGGSLVICGELPAEIQGVTVSGKDVSTIAWTPGPSGVTYDVVEDFITRLRSDRSAVNAACLSHGGSQASAIDPHAVPAGDGFYYLVRAASACAKGSFGNGSYGESRMPQNALACP